MNAVGRRSRGSALLLAALGLLALVALAVPAAAPATVPPKRCGKIIANHKPFAVRAHLISCDRARRGSKRFLRHGIRPDGWSCRRYPASVTSIAFTCRNGAKDFYAIRR